MLAPQCQTTLPHHTVPPTHECAKPTCVRKNAFRVTALQFAGCLWRMVCIRIFGKKKRVRFHAHI
jgi:hypothetical protein